MKKCFKCGLEKPLTEYYVHKQMADGHLNKCKSCTKKDVDEREKKLRNDSEWLEKEKSRQREKYNRLNYKEKHKKTPEVKKRDMQNYRKNNPEKYRARNKSQRIEVKVKGNHLHHWSYNKIHATDVIELNPKNHALIHRYLRYDKATFMYKTLEGILLDTREYHENYINDVISKNL